MKSLFQIIFLFFIQSQGFSQQKPIIANCESGQGCTFQLSDATYEDIDVIMGTDGVYANMPKDAMIVFTKIDGKWETFIEEKRSRSELDLFFGGDGYTMIYLFNPKLQPLNGQWKVNVGNAATSACFVDIAGIVKNGLTGVTSGGMITFPDPFNIKFLMNNQHVKWRMINPAQYQGVLDFGAGLGSPMKLTYDVTLENEEKISGLFTIRIKVPTKEACISKIPVTYICVKPNKGQRSKRGEIDPFAKRKKFDVERIPEEKKPNVERIPDEKKPNVERLPDEKKPNVERLPDEKKPHVERLPDEKKPKVERLPDN